MAISYLERVRTFGIAGNRNNTRTVSTPWGISVVCHELIVAHFLGACTAAQKSSGWVPKRIDSFAYRPIRNAVSTSLHSWALAWDFFYTPPGVVPPGGVWTPQNALPEDFGRVFEAYGFTWGKRWNRQDIPHIEWNGGTPPIPRPPVAIPPMVSTPIGDTVEHRLITVEVDHEGRGYIDVPDKKVEQWVSTEKNGAYDAQGRPVNIPGEFRPMDWNGRLRIQMFGFPPKARLAVRYVVAD